MSDLFDPLRDMTREPTSSLPATEVRRRGDQQRRRRTAVQVVGGAAAVAVVAFGALTVADRSPSTSREVPPASQGPSPTATQAPTPSESATTSGVATRVPNGFPLDQGMIQADEVDGPSRNVFPLGDITICGDTASYSPASVETDAVGVRHSSAESGPAQWRVLMVYPDAGTAHRMARDLVGKYEACPRYPVDTGDTGNGQAHNDVSSRALGDEAWTVKNGYTFNGDPQIGEDIYTVVRVGDAVMYQWAGGEGPGLTDPAAFEQAAQAELDGLAGPVAAMCVFTETGCASSDPSPTVTSGDFGPETFGDLRLYLTPEEVADTGQATVNDDAGQGANACRSLTYTGDEPGRVDGYVTSYGVEVLFAPDDAKTPEGLGVGSSVTDLERLYPDAEKIVSGYLIPLPGARRYAALVDGGEVVTLSLESNGQTCVR
jgi:hypothetical protein